MANGRTVSAPTILNPAVDETTGFDDSFPKAESPTVANGRMVSAPTILNPAVDETTGFDESFTKAESPTVANGQRSSRKYERPRLSGG